VLIEKMENEKGRWRRRERKGERYARVCGARRCGLKEEGGAGGCGVVGAEEDHRVAHAVLVGEDDNDEKRRAKGYGLRDGLCWLKRVGGPWAVGKERRGSENWAKEREGPRSGFYRFSFLFFCLFFKIFCFPLILKRFEK
jgi:hypothetical protein